LPAWQRGQSTNYARNEAWQRKLKTEFHNTPAIQLAASIAPTASRRRCQIGNMGVRYLHFLVHFAAAENCRSRGFVLRTPNIG
jgi:hypothetical protein